MSEVVKCDQIPNHANEQLATPRVKKDVTHASQ